MRMAAKLGNACLKRVAGAGGFVEKDQENRLVRKMQGGNPALELLFQSCRRIQGEFDFFIRPVLGHQPVAAFHWVLGHQFLNSLEKVLTKAA